MNIPTPLPTEGYSISPRASFAVFKSFPLLGIATNSLTPKLILFQDHIECRVLKTQRRHYEEIESVDALQTFGTQNVILFWRAGILAFSANLGKEELLIALLHFFRDRGNVLGDRARKILALHPK
ncbi:MAG TPA: hypothetical protein VHV54_05110 [Candidatus Binatia bacterium]|nr:hypothetical protein [Candidatus Binatia bacterium]